MSNSTAAQPLDLDRLEALAKAAEQMFTGMHWYTRFQILDGISNDESAAMIGALDPDTVLALIAQARTARLNTTASDKQALLDEFEHAIGGFSGGVFDRIDAIIQKHRATLAPVSAQQSAAEQHNTVECDSALRAEPAGQRDLPRTVLMEHEIGGIIGWWNQTSNSRYELCRAVETAVIARCRAEGGDTSDNNLSDHAAKAPAAQADVLGYAIFRGGVQVCTERTKRQAESWVDAEIVPLVAASPASTPEAERETGELIAAAEKHAEAYDGDDRECIKTDVINAFYQGAAWQAARRTPAATTGELPPLLTPMSVESVVEIADKYEYQDPESGNTCFDRLGFAQEVARAAIEADRAQRQVAPASAQPADEMTADEARAALKAMPLDQAVSMVRGAQPDQRDSANNGADEQKGGAA